MGPTWSKTLSFLPLQREFEHSCLFPLGPEIKYTRISTGGVETGETLEKLLQKGQYVWKNECMTLSHLSHWLKSAWRPWTCCLCHLAPVLIFHTSKRSSSKTGVKANSGSHVDCLLVYWLTAGKNTVPNANIKNLQRAEQWVVWSPLLSRKQYVSCQIPFYWVKQFLLWTCTLSEVSKVTKYIEGGDGHLFEDEEIKRLLQGG